MSILTLDDRSPSIVYSAGWGQAGSKLEFNSTTSWTRVAGTTAKVSFRGTSISVYGTISAATSASIAPTSVYSIDGGIPKIYQATQAARAQYRVLFYQSAVLPDAVHTLEISHPIASAPLFLDLFLISQVPLTPTVLPTSASGSITVSLPVTNSTIASSTPIISSTPTTSSTPTPPVVVTTPSVTPTLPTLSSPVPSTASVVSSAAADSASSLGAVAGEKKSNAGAVAGGVIGGIIVVFLLAFGYVIWRRRRRERMEMDALRFPPSTSWNNGGSGGTSATSPRRSFSLATPQPQVNTASRPVPPVLQAGASASSAYQQPYGGPTMYPGGYAREYPQQQMQQQAAPYSPSSILPYSTGTAANEPPAYGQSPAAQRPTPPQPQTYALPSQLIAGGAGGGSGTYDRYTDNYQDAYGGVASPAPAPAPTTNANYMYDNGPRTRIRLD